MLIRLNSTFQLNRLDKIELRYTLHCCTLHVCVHVGPAVWLHRHYARVCTICQRVSVPENITCSSTSTCKHCHASPCTLPTQSDPDNQQKIEFDWWSKYYYSIDDTRRTQTEYVDQGYDKMKVQSCNHTDIVMQSYSHIVIQSHSHTVT